MGNQLLCECCFNCLPSQAETIEPFLEENTAEHENPSYDSSVAV